MQTARIFDIQRFCIQDGPGIRTGVFFKGCPLRCIWCHNPESLTEGDDYIYRANKCVGCGACASACKYGVHEFAGGKHYVKYEKCVRCGGCINVCCYGAVSLSGRTITIEEMLHEIDTDIPYYGEDGGVTLTGGEPMMQPEFVLVLCKALKDKGVNICMETCGYAAARDFESIAPYIDTFLFDYKATSPEEHKRFTGASNELILANLKLLSSLGKNIILRCPVIPGFNDSNEHLQAIADIAAAHKMIQHVELLPYHRLGETKRMQMGRNEAMPDVRPPAETQKKQWLEYLVNKGCNAVIA